MAGENSKKTQGKQKIEIKEIEKKEDKLITFSKRRTGIYKKATELVILTDAQIAFMVYSPGGKPYTFAHPSMEAIINRFLNKQDEPNNVTNPMDSAQSLIRADEPSQEHNELLEQLDLEKEKEKELNEKVNGIDAKGWWDDSIDELTAEQILKRKVASQNLRTQLISSLFDSNDGASSSAQPSPQTLVNQQPPQNMFDPSTFDPFNPPFNG